MLPVKIEKELKARLLLEVLGCFDLPVAEKYSLFPVIHVLMSYLPCCISPQTHSPQSKNSEKIR